MSNRIISLENLLERITEHDVLAVSTAAELAEGGSLLLIIWAEDPKSVNESLQDIYGVLVADDCENESICKLDYVFEYYGLDFYGHIPLYLDEDLRYETLEGDVIEGQTIDEGISQLEEVWNEIPKSSVRVDNQGGGCTN